MLKNASSLTTLRLRDFPRRNQTDQEMELFCTGFETNGKLEGINHIEKVTVDKFAHMGIVLAKISLDSNDTDGIKIDAEIYAWLKNLIITNPMIMLGKQ